jgi:hypothetical protein
MVPTAPASATSAVTASAFAGDGLGLLQVRARIDDNRRATIRKRERDSAPDIASGAGDDGDAA